MYAEFFGDFGHLCSQFQKGVTRISNPAKSQTIDLI